MEDKNKVTRVARVAGGESKGDDGGGCWLDYLRNMRKMLGSKELPGRKWMSRDGKLGEPIRTMGVLQGDLLQWRCVEQQLEWEKRTI
jgi:hypothetical protein